jgi:hypothetical protein
MEEMELKEIREYWTNKYPQIGITLYGKSGNGKYCGRMMTHNSSLDLSADTIGELISQGESFLRKAAN